MIHAFYIFHINRCIFIAQYPQRGSSAAALAASDPAAAAAAAAAGVSGQQQQHYKGSTSNGARGASLRVAGGAGQQQVGGFSHGSLSVPLAGGKAGGGAPATAATRNSAAAALGGGSSSSSSGGRVHSVEPLGASGAVSWGPLSKREQQAGRLLSGLLFSMRRFCEQIGPASSISSSSSSGASFTAFATPLYKLHYLRTQTGYGFACLTSPEVAYLEEALQHIYGSLFVDLLPTNSSSSSSSRSERSRSSSSSSTYGPDMAHSAFATALYEQLPDRTAAAAAASRGPQYPGFPAAAAAAASAAAADGGKGGSVDLALQQRQQLLLQRAAMLQQCSFFELLAQQKLLDGLHAALRHCVVTLEAFYSDAPQPEAAPSEQQQQQQQQRELAGDTAGNQQQQQQQQQQQGCGRAGGVPQFRSLKGSLISAWVWRRLRRCAAAAKAAAAAAARPGVLRLLLRADAAAALRWVDRHFDALYVLLLAAVETHSFASTGAAFSEGFYCMQRADRRLFHLHRRLNYPPLYIRSSSTSGSEQEQQGKGSSSSRSASALQLPTELLQQQREISAEAAALAAELPPTLSAPKVFLCVAAQVLLPYVRRQLQQAHARQQQQSAEAAAAEAAAAAARLAAAKEAVAAAAAKLQQHMAAHQALAPLPLAVLLPHSSSSSSSSSSDREALLVTEAVSNWSARLQWWLRLCWLRVLLQLLRLRVQQQQLLRRLRRCLWGPLVSLYPWLSQAHGLASFAYALLYLGDPVAFPYWSPAMHLLGLVYVRAPPDAAAAAAAAGGSSSSNSSNRRRSWWFAAAEGGAQRMRSCLVAVLLLLRALEWWFEYESTLMPPAVKREDVAAPPAPPRPSGEESSLTRPLPQDARICPLCHYPRENPACIPSGYVFCYRCVLTFVRQHQRCPVTALHTSEQHVRRLYEARV
ncbi:hypothetical protein Efla_004227 [Eimeria flavescens]